MRYARMLTLPKERGDVKTLLVVCVRYQARILSYWYLLILFEVEFEYYWYLLIPNLITKDKILKLTNKLALTFGMGTLVEP